ncbi:hypothetical protein ACCT09_26105, partial [Rhizobium ruizarguesonis]
AELPGLPQTGIFELGGFRRLHTCRQENLRMVGNTPLPNREYFGKCHLPWCEVSLCHLGSSFWLQNTSVARPMYW